MITIPGSIQIRTIEGRHGPFVVGRLNAEIGEFTVKRGIEDFDAGVYAGEFTISRIYPASYVIGGRSIVELRADVEGIALRDIDTESEPEEAPTLVDTEENDTPVLPNEDAELFGPLWPLGEKVKLDPTVERAILRRQASRLRELGYRFQPVGRFFVVDKETS
ncbi:hypothetical protein B1C78_00565 [Thioalkalivibrio denitrificans]|uniref:DUF3275 domain-containing protein n=1 Tax=Thioalkalivibrio denitrificans TaxID=108003 RepID=A0A1V3NUP8_9GAMM|nr:DUF3275 family protein [Thioalkalivibrio denitrificans]OOG28859.1 hypothetical protein B1C78_00565 [Thioalkalivibrio denitrificans]